MEQDFHMTKILPIRSMFMNDGNDLLVNWTGNSWDGDEYEELDDILNEWGNVMTMVSVSQTFCQKEK